MTRIVGIDPGSRITGYGIIEFDRNTPRHVANGCIQVRGETLAEKLGVIYEAVSALVSTHHPDEMAVEQVFMHRNAQSALKLGHARGAALLAGIRGDLAVYEYAPSQIKQAITGRGHADKTQIQHMVRVLLGLREVPPSDAADALAVALCHGHTRATLARMDRAGAGGVSR